MAATARTKGVNLSNVLQPYPRVRMGVMLADPPRVASAPDHDARYDMVRRRAAVAPFAPRVPFCGRETPRFPGCRPVAPTHPELASAQERRRPRARPHAICPRAPVPGSDCKAA